MNGCTSFWISFVFIYLFSIGGARALSKTRSPIKKFDYTLSEHSTFAIVIHDWNSSLVDLEYRSVKPASRYYTKACEAASLCFHDDEFNAVHSL